MTAAARSTTGSPHIRDRAPHIAQRAKFSEQVRTLATVIA